MFTSRGPYSIANVCVYIGKNKISLMCRGKKALTHIDSCNNNKRANLRFTVFGIFMDVKIYTLMDLFIEKNSWPISSIR